MNDNLCSNCLHREVCRYNIKQEGIVFSISSCKFFLSNSIIKKEEKAIKSKVVSIKKNTKKNKKECYICKEEAEFTCSVCGKPICNNCIYSMEFDIVSNKNIYTCLTCGEKEDFKPKEEDLIDKLWNGGN